MWWTCVTFKVFRGFEPHSAENLGKTFQLINNGCHTLICGETTVKIIAFFFSKKNIISGTVLRFHLMFCFVERPPRCESVRAVHEICWHGWLRQRDKSSAVGVGLGSCRKRFLSFSYGNLEVCRDRKRTRSLRGEVCLPASASLLSRFWGRFRAVFEI